MHSALPVAGDARHRSPRRPKPGRGSRPASRLLTSRRCGFGGQLTALLCQTENLWPTEPCGMSRGSSQQFTGVDFDSAWDAIHHELRAWLKAKRFVARPAEVDDVVEAAKARIRKSNWNSCRNEARSNLGTDTANKSLMAAFSRAVRTVEIEKWSRLILGDGQLSFGKDHRPVGPLSLPDTWRYRLPAPWSSHDNKFAAVLQEELGELALSGWAALGGYGLQADPGEFFLNQLQQRLKWHKTHGTWEAALYGAKDSEGRPLLKVFEKQAEKEFNDPADGERAYQWAIEYLVKE